MKFWIDCEWNDFQGELISFAIVPKDGPHLYAEVEWSGAPASRWIADNVMPHLRQITQPIPVIEAQAKLAEYLNAFLTVEIYADWPEDIERMCRLLIVGPGKTNVYRKITFQYLPGFFEGSISAIPHRALEDAQSLRDVMFPPKTAVAIA